MEHGPSSLLRGTRGRPAGEAQRRERANAGESCVVIGRNATARYAFIRSQSPLARSVFCFFSSRKENVPLLFRRTRGRLRGEAQRRERANAGESCVVIGRNAAARYPSSAANPPRPAVSFASFLQEKKPFPFSLEEPAVGSEGKADAYPGPSAVRLRARRAPRAAASCSLRGRAARQSRSRRQGSRSCLRAQCAQARASCRS